MKNLLHTCAQTQITHFVLKRLHNKNQYYVPPCLKNCSEWKSVLKYDNSISLVKAFYYNARVRIREKEVYTIKWGLLYSTMSHFIQRYTTYMYTYTSSMNSKFTTVRFIMKHRRWMFHISIFSFCCSFHSKSRSSLTRPKIRKANKPATTAVKWY